MGLIAAAILVFVGISFTRFQTSGTVEKLTDYADGFDLYRVDIKYRYDPERMMKPGLQSNQMVKDAILKEAMPLLSIHLESPDYGCSSFSITDAEGRVLTGRNYDFDFDSYSHNDMI